MNCVYRIDGATAHTQSCAAGPWSPDMQHGGAPASLIAWAAERIPTREPMRVVRLTVDLLRPVPVAPLEIRTDVVREGRKIQLCAISLLNDGAEVVRASVLKVRDAEVVLPETAVEETILLPGPERGVEPDDLFGGGRNAFVGGLDLRVVKGGFRIPGPGAIWFRAHRPVIDGEAISPLMRAVLTSDFCNGVSSVLDFRRWTFINADVSINLARQPIGDWILLDAQTWLGANGAGVAFAKLGDERGYFGRAVQSLVIEQR
jgi:Thioesterase-like superfamily